LRSMISTFLTMVSLVCGQVHEWNVISVTQWARCQLANTLDDDFHFVDIGNKTISGMFPVEESMVFGLVLEENVSFEMIFSVTCVVDVPPYAHYPRSVILVTAAGPAQPQARIINYDGAIGSVNFTKTALHFDFEF
jgi:hypothetical protein